MNIVVLGYTGFVGQNLIDYYSKKKEINLFLIYRNKKKIYKNTKKKKYIYLKSRELKKLLKNEKIDILIYCISKVYSKFDSYNKYIKINVIFLKNFLKLLKKTNLKNFIYLSTINVYGKKIINANESLKPNPIDDYSKTKFKAEELIKKNLKEKKINFLILRLPLIYGKIGLKGGLKIANDIIKKIPFVVTIRFGNKKSMLGSKNLADFILFVNKKKKYFSSLKCKIFNITDRDNYSTEDIFFFFSKIYKKKFFYIKIFNNVVKLILNYSSKGLFEKYFGSYTINTSKIKKTGWKAPYKFIDHF